MFSLWSVESLARSWTSTCLQDTRTTDRDPIRRCEFVAVGDKVRSGEGDGRDTGREMLFSLAHRIGVG